MRYFIALVTIIFTLFIPSVLASDDDLLGENIVRSERSELQFTAQELAWIDANESVTVIGDASWLPFEGFDKSGHYMGIVAEVLNLITVKSGLVFDVKQTVSWQHSLQFSENKQVDIISASASNAIIEKNYRATYSTIKSPIVMIANNDTAYISDLSTATGLRIALIGTAGYSKQIIEAYPEVDFIKIEEIDEGLLGVAEEHYDLVLMSMMVASYQMAELGLYELRVVGITDLEMQLTLFVNRNKPILWSIIDKVKRHESKQEHHKILSKWAKDNSIEHYSPEMLRIFTVISFLLLFTLHRHFLIKKQVKRLKLVSQTDPLTGGYSRLYLHKILLQQIEQCVFHQSDLSLVMVDIDNLKLVNDKHGYLAGDKLLQQFALLLKDNITNSDLIGHWTGGEFIIVCVQKDRQQARILAEKLRSEVVQTIFLGVGKKTASFGIAQYQPCESAETFLGRADKALYYAKGSGRNKVKSEF